MNHAIAVIKHIFTAKDLRQKILFTLFLLVIFRLLAHTPIPGADVAQVQTLLNQQANAGLQVLGLLTGGAMENFSIVLMGLTPYINASIIMQLLTVIVPSLENLKKEGEAGQKKISQYTRLLTIPLAFLQSFGMLSLLNRFSTTGSIVDTSDLGILIPTMLIITAGTAMLMWIGELITERGIGNGISLLIFAGIISVVPQQVAGSLQSASTPVLVGLLLTTIALIAFVVYVSEGDRRVPVIYSSRKSEREQRSFLPLKVNQAGMIPIIFAISIVSFPSILAQFFVQSTSPWLAAAGDFIQAYLNPASPTFIYNMFYGLLIFGFTYFYVSIIFDPKKIAENIQSRNGYVPGYRPGRETESFFALVTHRLCFWGGSFLAFVAIFPVLFESWIGGGGNSISLFISGASIIIVVGVVLDLMRRINSHMVSHNYDKL